MIVPYIDLNLDDAAIRELTLVLGPAPRKDLAALGGAQPVGNGFDASHQVSNSKIPYRD